MAAVIGDGALTGGMAFEAMNNAAELKTNFVIVLNDNEMSISRNVGGISDYLADVRTSSAYTGFKMGLSSALEKLPGVGRGDHGHAPKDQEQHQAADDPRHAF